MSLVFSDCAYVVFDRPKDAERFAVHAMRSIIRNDMPVRMGLSYGSFTNFEFKTGVLPNGHLMFAAPFMGTAVVIRTGPSRRASRACESSFIPLFS